MPRDRLVKKVPAAAGRRATKTSVVDADAIVQAHEAGESVGQLALRFGLHRGTIHNLLDAARVPRWPRCLDESQDAQAVRMYTDGLSVAKVARHFELAPSGIDRLLKRTGECFATGTGVSQRSRQLRPPASGRPRT